MEKVNGVNPRIQRSEMVNPATAVATAGWPALAQTKWAAKRRKLDLTDQCLESFEEQLAEVVQFVDPIFTGVVRTDAVWDRAIKRWRVS